jgi:phospholipase C
MRPTFQLVCASVAVSAGGLDDVKHVVIFMQVHCVHSHVASSRRFVVCDPQENRPFDHYYGTLKGVRGFNDAAAPLLPNGDPVWRQPINQRPKTCKACVSWTGVWCYHDDTCYKHGDKDDQKAFSCPGSDRCASDHGCSCSSCDQTQCQPKIPYAISCQHHEGGPPSPCPIEGQYCPPQNVINHDGQQPDGDCCIKGAWTPGVCPASILEQGPPRNESVAAAAAAAAAPSYMLPFPLDFKSTSASCMSSPGMSYPQDIAMRNEGQFDGWASARDPGMGMAYFNRR